MIEANMDDPENGGGGATPSRSTKGVPIYAIESLVVSVIEFAWLALPLAAGISFTADQVLLLPLALAGVLNVLLCSLVQDNRTALGAFASLAITCTLGYLLVFLESMAVEPYARVFFNGNALLHFLGAVTLALMALHCLLALAAIHERLWRQTAWIEGTIFLMPCLLTAACIQSGQDNYGLFAVAVSLVFWLFTSVLALVNDHLRLLFVLSRLAAIATALAGSLAAIGTGLTQWAYPTLTVLVFFLYACRSINDWRQIREINRSNAPLHQVVPTAPPAPPAVENQRPSAQGVASMTHRPSPSHGPFSALQGTNPNAEAVLFGGHSRYFRQQTKKRI